VRSLRVLEADADSVRSVHPERDVCVDALRGLAVLTMVGAHLARYTLDQPYPFWLRVYASLAAPAFIFLAGFMAGLSHARRPAPFARHLKRTLALLLVACLIDMLLWREPPFTSFDVLYLIALVSPASYLALRLPRAATLLVAAVVLLATPALHQVIGYETGTVGGWEQLQALFVDGWFPVFPWLGVGILGAALGAFRHEAGPASFARGVALLGALLFVVGIVIWWLTSPEHRTAGGFAELFYPPTLGVLLAILGPELCLLVLLSGPVRSRLWRALAVYGRAALAMYVAHLALIAFVLKPWFERESIVTFGITYLVLALALWWLALAIRWRWPAPRSFWGRLMLGS
jgi:uncharacterized membrane protein